MVLIEHEASEETTAQQSDQWHSCPNGYESWRLEAELKVLYFSFGCQPWSGADSLLPSKATGFSIGSLLRRFSMDGRSQLLCRCKTSGELNRCGR
jgi:hypothetical protein